MKLLNTSIKKLRLPDLKFNKRTLVLLGICIIVLVGLVYYMKNRNEGFIPGVKKDLYFSKSMIQSIKNFDDQNPVILLRKDDEGKPKKIVIKKKGDTYLYDRKNIKSIKFPKEGTKNILVVEKSDETEPEKHKMRYLANETWSSMKLVDNHQRLYTKISNFITDINEKINPLTPETEPAAATEPAATEPAKGKEYTYTGDVSQIDCIEKCLDANVESKVCFDKCGKWAVHKQKELETCKYNPGGITPEDCKTRCEEYYKIVDPENTTCIKSCESKCNSCNSSRCKWLQYGDVTEFPYKLSIFGVPGNGKVTVNWEKPPYDVKKYIIMYFEEEKQNESGVSFIEVYGNECKDDKYCTYTITGLTNNKNYVIGVSIIFQNDNVTRTSERLVLRPEEIVRQLNETEEERDTLTPSNSVQSRTPSQILTNALRAEQSRARSQKIIRDFKESEEEQVSSLFSYLAKSPINLEFKLS